MFFFTISYSNYIQGNLQFVMKLEDNASIQKTLFSTILTNFGLSPIQFHSILKLWI